MTSLGSDFYVWTFAYDISGIKNLTFYYRKDNDGENSLSDTNNEVYYSDHMHVSAWTPLLMAYRVFPKVLIP